MSCGQVQAPWSDLVEGHRKCWCPSCTKTAWLEDWASWHWCFYHAYRNWRWGGGPRWYYLKTLKFRWPYLSKKE